MASALIRPRAHGAIRHVNGVHQTRGQEATHVQKTLGDVEAPGGVYLNGDGKASLQPLFQAGGRHGCSSGCWRGRPGTEHGADSGRLRGPLRLPDGVPGPGYMLQA